MPNRPIAERLGVDDRWIVKRTGVRERRVAQPGERLTDLAADASRAALRAGGIDAAEVDLVLVGTFTQDEILPNAAPRVAAAIGAANAGAVDIGAACLGFLAGLSLATACIEAGRARCALVVGAELLTRCLDPHDRGTAALIGDGAGAVVVTAVRAPGRIGPAILRTSDEAGELISMTRVEPRLRMDGQRTFARAVDRLVAVTAEAVDAAALTLDDVDLFVYHQANARITRAVGARLRLPPARVVDCIERLGNTSAASIPLALAAAERDGRLRDNALVLLAACGAGFMWGAVILEWGRDAG